MVDRQMAGFAHRGRWHWIPLGDRNAGSSSSSRRQAESPVNSFEVEEGGAIGIVSDVDWPSRIAHSRVVQLMTGTDNSESQRVSERNRLDHSTVKSPSERSIAH